MLELFYSKTPIKFTSKTYPRFTEIQKNVLEDLNELVMYYNDSNYYLKNNHLLVRLVMLIVPNPELELFKFIKTVESNINRIVKILDMSNPLHTGRVHNGIFYGDNSNEILISVENRIPIEHIIDDWKRIESVKVIYHEDYTLDLDLPNGSNRFNMDALSIFEINILALALQYKMWYMEIVNDLDAISNNASFISRYVIPNILYSHLDIVIFNRLVAIYNNIDLPNRDFKHPVDIRNPEHLIDRMLAYQLKYLEDKSIDYGQFLYNIPSFNSDTLLDQLSNTNYPDTKQIRWCKLLSTFNIIQNVILIAGPKSYSNNKELITRLKQQINIVKRDKTYLNILDTDTLNDFNNFIDFIELL